MRIGSNVLDPAQVCLAIERESTAAVLRVERDRGNFDKSG
jgi:hypothetical protein